MKHLKYRNKLQEISKNSRALNNEIGFVKKKIEEIKSDMNQLENNLGGIRLTDKTLFMSRPAPNKEALPITT